MSMPGFRHVVGVGDAVEGVARHHRIGGGAVLVGLEGGVHLAHGHQVFRLVDRLHGHRVQKLRRDGILVGVFLLHAVQQLVQGVLILDRAHHLAVHQHLVLAQLAADAVQLSVKVVLHIRLCGEIGAQGEGELIVQLPLDLVVVAQQGGAGALHGLDGLLDRVRVGHHAHQLPVQGDRVAGGVQGGDGERHRQRPGAGQKGDRPGGAVARHHIVELVGEPPEMDAAPLPQSPAVEGGPALETGPALPQGQLLRGGPAGKFMFLHDILHALPRQDPGFPIKGNRPGKKRLQIGYKCNYTRKWLLRQVFSSR